ncbi:MAG: methyltransferase domain-containing protein [Planctomycetes bacterium]|nr:methyltransferase domain-containing protein [Planctomycetota bacterium]
MSEEPDAAPGGDSPPHLSLASRAGLKLRHALEAFPVDAKGKICADFGCNIGGFTDVLLRAGAARVISVDTGYGTLAWRLRNDPRVETRERTNALHADPPEGGVDLVVMDLAWTQQRLSVPAALRWLRPGGKIVTLVKPHYEVEPNEKSWLDHGFLPHDKVPIIVGRVRDAMRSLGASVLADAESPITGGKSSRRAGSPGNKEWLMLLQAARV